eukprot:CAMPEP_0169130712 /NCGR_PEP_ID=MMETSP1015-20121227/37851_1 /TAXON_ID=342587 /ORGANISM="Karlodinium micrum, Strain CCMP2283" /LENGTH=173 /DNA_ID=CAMNT_0009194907 /DNA_START=73 /DNA_END=594 /DNA_ORIENTATION=-
MTSQVKFTIVPQGGAAEQTFTVTVHPEWAPLGAERFIDLVKDGNFTEGRFYRVIADFMVQFGIAADPSTYNKWSKMIKDDPVKQSNTRGKISFAMRGPDTRSCQIFINFGNNSNLDSQGFSPFAEVTEGMDVVDKIFACGDEPYRCDIKNQGNKAFPPDMMAKLGYVVKAEVL